LLRSHPPIPLVMPPVPSMLDLVRLSPRRLFPPGGVELFRQVALLTDMSEGDEVLCVACGKGVAPEYFAREWGVQASGVELDPLMIEQAEAAARALGLAGRLTFQTGSLGRAPVSRRDLRHHGRERSGSRADCEPQAMRSRVGEGDKAGRLRGAGAARLEGARGRQPPARARGAPRGQAAHGRGVEARASRSGCRRTSIPKTGRTRRRRFAGGSPSPFPTSLNCSPWVRRWES
jgi:hypothetical protein